MYSIINVLQTTQAQISHHLLELPSHHNITAQQPVLHCKPAAAKDANVAPEIAVISKDGSASPSRI
jgi:hypothetical protein